jgi:hypothetical protein
MVCLILFHDEQISDKAPETHALVSDSGINTIITPYPPATPSPKNSFYIMWFGPSELA